MTREIELLAPAGSTEALVSAVENGADAIYLGGKLLNARKYASNFEEKELIEAIRYAHLHGVKIYVTVNILVGDSEIDEAMDYIRFLYESDVDAVIVQDLGLASLIHRLFPKLEIHGSTQMTINNLYGAKYLEKLGFTRVILARETPVEEIRHIKENSKIELESFVHGALCMAYSGQCLMSSFIGGRSGNRGTCAQPCRMEYHISDEEGVALEKIDKLHYLSPKDLNTIDYIEELIDAGISSLKIEGRMKRKEYVATVVKTYRKALDKGNSSITREDREDLTQIFNRGFTKGLGFSDFGRSFMSVDRPDNRGVLAGNIVDVDRKNIYIKLITDIDKGDGIEFQLSNGSYKGLLAPKDAKAGDLISIFKRGHVDIDSKVYRTSSLKLMEKINEKESQAHAEPITMDVVIKQDEKPKLTVYYENYKVEVELDKIVEKSKNIALTEDKVEEQLARLGDTDFYLEDIKIDLDDNSFMTHKDLNRLRREALEKLVDKMTNFNSPIKIDEEDYKVVKEDALRLNPFNRDDGIKLSIKIENMGQLRQLNFNKMDRIYLPINGDLESMLDEVENSDLEVYLWTDKILYHDDLEDLKRIVDLNQDRFKGIWVSNLGSLEYFKERYDKKFHGDIGLNIFNSYSASYFLNELSSISLSSELNLKQIKRISNNVKGNLESIVYGYVPVMITKNCPFATIKNCKNDDKCNTCKYSEGYGLYDRKAMNFKSFRRNGHSIIYNSVPLMLLDKLNEINDAGVNIFRLDFTHEKGEIEDIQTMYYDYLNGNIDYNHVLEFVEGYKEDKNITMGHFYRGII